MGHWQKRKQNGNRQCDNGDERGTDVPEKHEADEGDNDAFLNELFAQGGDGAMDKLAAVVGRDEFDSFRQRRFDFLQLFLDAVDDVQRIFAVAHHNNAPDHFTRAIQLSHAPAQVRAEMNCAYVLHEDRGSVLRLPGELPRGPAWLERSQIETSAGEVLWINEYFAAHPEMMLGEMRLSGRMYQRGEPTLVPDGGELETQLAEAVGRLPKDVYRADERVGLSRQSNLSIPAPQDIKPNAFALINGDLAVRDGDSMRIVSDLPSTTVQRIRGMVRLRDAVRRCLRSQIESQNESDVVLAREQLNQSYDSFTAKFGPIYESSNASAFRSDPDLPLLLSLERFDPETRRAVKAAIFRERTIRREAPAPQIGSPKDALLVTLNAVDRGQPLRLILRVEKAVRFEAVSGFQTLLSAGGVVMNVEDSVPAIQSPCLLQTHNSSL
jgi:hypothetical protein